MEAPNLISKTSTQLFAAMIAAKANRSPQPPGTVTVAEFAADHNLSACQANRLLNEAYKAGAISREKWNGNGHIKFVYRLIAPKK
jgi:predicted transcriptional regulator